MVENVPLPATRSKDSKSTKSRVQKLVRKLAMSPHQSAGKETWKHSILVRVRSKVRSVTVVVRTLTSTYYRFSSLEAKTKITLLKSNPSQGGDISISSFPSHFPSLPQKMIYRFCAVLLLLSPTLSTTPGERVLELLSQVKTNTESHEEIADQHESIRAGVCQSKTTVLAEKIAVLRSRLLAVNGHPIDPSVAELNATESGRANLTETTILDSITTAHRQQDIDVYVHQMSKLSSLRNTIANGFQHNLDGFSTALNIRSMSHDMFVNHQTQYDSYASTMDMMLSLMERHAGKEEAHAAVRAAETQEVAEHADVLNQKTIENEEHKVEQHQQQELYDARAERMYETVVAVSKQLAEHMALERALDKEADDAWSVALLERTQLGEETDTMLKDLDQKKVVLQKEISNLGGLMKGNASATIVPVDPEIILKLKTEMKRYNEELGKVVFFVVVVVD